MTDQTPASPTPDERNESVERITAQYADEYRAGRSPRPDEYIKRFPQYARELAEFFLYFHTIIVDLPDPDPTPTAPISSAARAALARFHQHYAQQNALSGLATRANEIGLLPPALAQQVGVSLDLFARLEARAIKAAEIPRTLIRRLAAALQVAPEAVAQFLSGASGGQGAQTSPGFFYADTAPKTKQDGFLEAVRASAMSLDQKTEWERIAHDEGIDA